MNIEKFNAWLSFAGHIAVLAGLIALTIEIRDNTTAVRAQELGAVWEQEQARQLASMTPEFGELYVKALYSPDELSLSELVNLVPYINHWLQNLQRVYQARVDGIVRESDWSARLSGAPIFLGGKFGHLFWEEIKGDYANQPGFVQAIDQALQNSPVVPDDQWYLSFQGRLQGIAQ